MLRQLTLTKGAVVGLVRRIEEHRTLLSLVMRRTGVDLAPIEGYGGKTALRNAFVRCIGRSLSQECCVWLGEAEPRRGAAQLLPRRSAVHRPFEAE